MKEINMFDAKTHFSGIIAEVIDDQEEFIIKKRGKKVAKIIPYQEEERMDVKDVIKAMDALSQEVGSVKISAEEIRKMREEGRS